MKNCLRFFELLLSPLAGEGAKHRGVWRWTLMAGLVASLAACSGGQLSPRSENVEVPAPLYQAHAHNDYEHNRPLMDALDHGFMSVEADVYADPVLGLELYVAHDPQDIRFARTLRSLYLDPMQARIDELGVLQPGQDRPFQLLVDFKTEAETTWSVLEEQLEDYAGFLTRYEDGQVIPGLVTVVISGNRPTATLAAEGRRLAFIDGRLPDLENPPPPELVPLVSDNWGNHFSWRGEGEMPAEERDKLAEVMVTAQAIGYRIRFWATPDAPGPARTAIWAMLYEHGVHHINTDDMAGLERFLRERQVADAN